MRCRDVMVAGVVTCVRTDPGSYAARLMKEHRVGFLPVLDEQGRVAGVLTDRDLALRLLAEGRPPETPAADLMTGGPVVCQPGEDLREAEARMTAAHVSRVVVVDAARRPLGVVSVSDIARAVARARAGRVLSQIRRRLPGPQTLP